MIAKILVYVNDGTILHSASDEPVPEINQEIGFLSPEGVSHWLIEDVTSEHIEELGGTITRAVCVPS